jgi:hypothetical protein
MSHAVEAGPIVGNTALHIKVMVKRDMDHGLTGS